MSDITDIVSAMGGYQAATPQDKTALEAVLGSRGGRQRDGGGGGGTAQTIFNTIGTSTLTASQVDGFTPRANALDTRLVALGV